MRAKSITAGMILATLVFAAPAMAEGRDRPKLDTDGDGYVTPEEFSQSRLSERVDFSAIDADGDNLLSMDELKSYAQENRKRRGRGRRTES